MSGGVQVHARHARGVDRVGDVVIGRVHWEGRGKASGVLIDAHAFDLYELRDGKVVRPVLGFGSMDKALEAADAAE